MKKSLLILSVLALSAMLSANLVLAREAESGSGSSGSGSGSDDSVSSRSSDDSSSSSSSDDSGSGFELETEHGVTFLKPHGVSGGDFARALGIESSSEGMEVETEHGVTFLKMHGTRDTRLENRLAGRILLQVQSSGEAWWIDPVTKARMFLGRPADAFNVMRGNGLGITNANLAQISKSDDNRPSGNLARNLAGRILLQVEDNGEAWYVNPVTLKRHFLGRPADAFNVMRNLGLGITNDDINKIRVRVSTDN